MTRADEEAATEEAATEEKEEEEAAGGSGGTAVAAGAHTAGEGAGGRSGFSVSVRNSTKLRRTTFSASLVADFLVHASHCRHHAAPERRCNDIHF